MSIPNENTEKAIAKLDQRMKLAKPQVYEKGYVKNPGGEIVVVAKDSVEDYAARDKWSKASDADIKKYLGKKDEPVEDADDGGDAITAADIRKLSKNKFKQFMEDYAGDLEGIEFKEGATDAEKKDAVIKYLELEE